ncbi:MAG: response regulator [Planctomycetes bacterium]|nr:response regulator [Planctomycetota bacterium]
MDDEPATLLIVEDDLDNADMLNAFFRAQGYTVQTVNWEEDSVRACLSNTPDLVILDIRLPDIDGFEVARRLRANRCIKDLPIIFLTEKRGRTDKLAGLALNAEDYITRPFDMQELRLRTRNALKRSRQSSLTNPVTSLPTGALVNEHLGQGLQSSDWALMVTSLGNFEHFREVYGFVASDDLLRALAIILQESVQDFGGPVDFLGHLTYTDFIVITRTANLQKIKENLQKRLEQSFNFFYRDQDRSSEVFRGQLLSFDYYNLLLNQTFTHELSQLKTELGRLYQQLNP